MRGRREPRRDQQKAAFPRLMEYHDGTFVVMFESPNKGMCVDSICEEWSIGEIQDDLVDIASKFWRPFTGKIILSND